MGNCHRARPNEVLVVSGGCSCRKTNEKLKTIVGGRTWAWSFFTKVQRLSLELITLSPSCDPAWTLDGEEVTVTGTVQLQVSKKREEYNDMLLSACQLFLDKNIQEIQNILLNVVEGNIKSHVGSLTLEDIFADQNKVTEMMHDNITGTVNSMGFEMNSLLLYLEPGGKTQTVVHKQTLEEMRMSNLRD